MEEGSRRAAAAAVLPDDLVVEILTRLPAKSLCRFKCVSRAWCALISDPAHSRRFAQTLSGFFFARRYGTSPRWGFVGLTSPAPGVDTALSFLPSSFGEKELLDSCNGLILLRCSGALESPLPPFYVVCNPATREWVALSQPSHPPGHCGYSDEFDVSMDTCSAALGFDPSISPHFHVFQLVQKEDQYHYVVAAVEIYSSETGRWVLWESRWSEHECILFTGQMTYFNGFLHFCIVSNAIASVDTKGQTWRLSCMRHHDFYGYGSSVGHSQGRLLYMDDNDLESNLLSIYVLEDHDSEEWTFKQYINKLDLFGPRMSQGEWKWNYCVAAFHPNRDLIFFYDWSQERLMSYDMNHRDVHVICTLGEVFNLVHGEAFDVRRPFLPYVPLYSGALASSVVK